MSIYNTKQRRALLAFLEEHPDELLTARQMADALAEFIKSFIVQWMIDETQNAVFGQFDAYT